MALSVNTTGFLDGLLESMAENMEAHSRWVRAMSENDLEFVDWDNKSPGGPWAIWKIVSTGEYIAT